ncbi:MAG: amino acid ABC transporter ATP-binding protein, partial [Bombilactobacillus sp.]|nr:amino acid ABC transporter ATP-binding protein [Bombilactobacillus sp.]
ANRVIFMDKGQIVEDDDTTSFFKQPKTVRAQQFLSKIISH